MKQNIRFGLPKHINSTLTPERKLRGFVLLCEEIEYMLQRMNLGIWLNIRVIFAHGWIKPYALYMCLLTPTNILY